MLRNHLADHLTTWKWWYAILALIGFLLGSMIAIFANVSPWMVPVSFLAFAAVPLLLIGLVSRSVPTAADLGLRAWFTVRDVVVILAVYLGSHAIFFLLGLLSGGADTSATARSYFEQFSLDKGLTIALSTLIASAILAPVCEELLYRGMILRPVHDSLARRRSPWVAGTIAIAVSAVAFALPHLGGEAASLATVQYLLTGAAFGLVYVLTGSMTAAMVAHSLQSLTSFAQILILGRGDTEVPLILWIVVFGCPIWTYLTAQLLRLVLPKGSTSGEPVRAAVQR